MGAMVKIGKERALSIRIKPKWLDNEDIRLGIVAQGFDFDCIGLCWIRGSINSQGKGN